MPVVAVVNRKGGSGKSTIATHIAAWCANAGLSVMLGDVDRQQSTRTWLRLRGPGMSSISPWAMDQKNVLRVPSGITHVVLDTPGGLHGFELARVVMFADAIIVPLCNSVFDRESAAACHAELKLLPRVASGRCRVGTVGMRIDARTRSAQVLEEWSEQLGLPYVGSLRDTQTYVRCIEQGLTVFDLPPSRAQQDLLQWQPILNWLEPVLRPLMAANDPAPAPAQPARTTQTARPAHLMPAQESMVHGARLATAGARGAPAAAPAARTQVLKPASTVNAPIPRFLQR